MTLFCWGLNPRTVLAVILPVALLITVRDADVSPWLAGVFPGSQIGVRPGISSTDPYVRDNETLEKISARVFINNNITGIPLITVPSSLLY